MANPQAISCIGVIGSVTLIWPGHFCRAIKASGTFGNNIAFYRDIAQDFNFIALGFNYFSGKIAEHIFPGSLDKLIFDAQVVGKAFDQFRVHLIPAAGDEFGIGNP